MKIYGICPKCSGSITTDYEDYFCIQCRLRVPIPFKPPTLTEYCPGSGVEALFARFSRKPGYGLVTLCKECSYNVQIDNFKRIIKHRKIEKRPALPAGSTNSDRRGRIKVRL